MRYTKALKCGIQRHWNVVYRGIELWKWMCQLTSYTIMYKTCTQSEPPLYYSSYNWHYFLSIISGRIREGATGMQPPPPPPKKKKKKINQLYFCILFCIRMLQNKAQIASKALELPRALKCTLDPGMDFGLLACEVFVHIVFCPPPKKKKKKKKKWKFWIRPWQLLIIMRNIR